MLALRQNRMDPKQHLDPALPFGYIPESPPEPPSGAPLLSEHETLDLQNWLGNVADPRLFSQSYGEGMPFDMLDLAPELLGSATSYGREPDIFLDSSPASAYHLMASPQELSPAMSAGPRAMAPPPPPPHTHNPHSQHSQHSQHVGPNSSPTPDVVAAASLLQHGPTGLHSTGNGHLHHNLNLGGLGEMGSLGLMALSQPVNHVLSNGQNHDNKYRFPMGQGGQTGYLREAPPSQPQQPKMHWGSDTNFHNLAQGFVSHSASETLEALHQGQLSLLGCLRVNSSAATTRPSSPTTGRASPTKTQSRRASDFAVETNDPDAPPRKRQKGRCNDNKTSPSSTPSALGPQKAGRRRKQNNDSDGPRIAEGAEPTGANGSLSATPRQRRRKSTGGKKPARENLTECQKRENHIRSEQKRRTLIKEGFAEISTIVPKLRGGGYSKSNMLQTAADWLEKLLDSNRTLREELTKVGA